MIKIHSLLPSLTSLSLQLGINSCLLFSNIRKRKFVVSVRFFENESKLSLSLSLSRIFSRNESRLAAGDRTENKISSRQPDAQRCNCHPPLTRLSLLFLLGEEEKLPSKVRNPFHSREGKIDYWFFFLTARAFPIEEERASGQERRGKAGSYIRVTLSRARNYRDRPSPRQFVKAVIIPVADLWHCIYMYIYIKYVYIGCLPPQSSEIRSERERQVSGSRMKTIHFRGDPRRSFDARLELKPIAAADRPRFDRANTPSSFCSAEELLFPRSSGIGNRCLGLFLFFFFLEEEVN